ncbi:hypothetical protein GGE65_004013 [Skermanella aerolata]|jgi:hypothetical protein|uniref:Uncharacterized protein n=1 Tax=Skermanella aerolata TaxID=393310 RepID=A0A512DJE7_9PROT|nr:hypothetical protein [Skermanella aerolata]KJB97704.1 hypothetical protein N826_00090 [Skermanella aerolata KACC 11604]GEO36608.1 hypothetical protein SAE02_07560 [Skermanella aerolata]
MSQALAGAAKATVGLRRIHGRATWRLFLSLFRRYITACLDHINDGFTELRMLLDLNSREMA